MKINKIFLLSIFLLFGFNFSVSKVHASILFQDNFDSGNASQWTPLQGNWIVQDGRYGSTVFSGSTLIHSIATDITSPNYSIDLDILPVLGEDKNIAFRFSNGNPRYEVHFNTGGAHFGGIPDAPSVSFTMNNTQTYHVRVELVGNNIKFFANNNQLFDITDPNYQFPGHEQIGLRIGTGSTVPSEIWFDNVVVRTIDDNSVDLNVPLLKQTDQLWGGQVYDSADKWSSAHPGISSWGCAMTSAAMIFKFHGINKLPDGTDLNPGTLNSWLKAQPDGYVRNGWLNWVALSRMSKLSKAQNPGFSYDALEYNRKNGFDPTVLINDLKNFQPDIVEEPGHFIVGKGIKNDVFTINDPFYDRADLTPYSNSFLSLSRYTPSNTDLSYIMLVVDSNIDIVLKDVGGNLLGESFIQSPIINAEFGGSSGNSLKILYFKAPQGGDYNVFLSSSDSSLYKLEEYLYDQNGNVYLKTIDGVIEKNKTDNINIHFDKAIDTGSQSNSEITFDSVLSDLNAFYNLGLVKMRMYKSFFSQIQVAKKLNAKHPRITKEILKELKEDLVELQKEYKKIIKTEVLIILIADINSLLAKY